MTALAEALAAGAEYTHGGKAYRLAPWDFDMMAAMELAVENDHVASNARVMAALPEHLQEVAVAALQRDLTNGLYTFGTLEMAKALGSRKHTVYAMFLALKRHHPELTLEQVRKMAREDYAGMLQALNRANRKEDAEGEEGGDPNAKAA